MTDEWKLRRDLCEAGRSIHARGLVGGTDGNVSARLPGDRFLISRSGSCLGRLEPGDLVTVDSAGRVVEGNTAPSSERWMHLAAYAQRPDVMNVIHAHPPVTIALTVAGVSLSQCALPEVIIAFGQVPVTDYATPGTEEGAAIVRDLVRKFDALVLDRHGSLTVGKTIDDALFKLEKLEHGSHVLFMAHQLGGIRDLPPEEIAKLAALREQFGLGSAADVASTCIPPGTPIPRITRGPDSY